MKVHQYNLDGSYAGIQEIESNQHSNSALNGYKGYGFYENTFISREFLSKIMTKDEEKKHFDKWCAKNIDRIQKDTKRKYKEWSDDSWQDAVLYVYDCVLSDRGVNNPENSITFKYVNTLKDSGRKRVVKMKTESSDFSILDASTGNVVSFIDTFAMESMTLDSEDRCTIDINLQERFTILIEKLMQYFDRNQINVWANYYMYDAGVRKRGASHGYAGTAIRSGLSKSGVRDIIKLVDSKMLELGLKDDVIKQFNEERYRDSSEWNLSYLINN